MVNKTRVLVTVSLSDELIKEIKSVSEGIEILHHPASTAEDVPEAAWQAANILYTLNVFPQAGQAPQLRWIQTFTAGVERLVGSPIYEAQNLLLTHMSGANAPQVAEHILTMMLALGHNLPRFFQLQAKNKWMQDKGHKYSPVELSGKAVGIVGYGSIGRQVARLVRGFGADVLAIKRDVMHPGDDGFIQEGFGDPEGDLFTRLYPPEAMRSMFSLSDFVVITVPLTSQTKGSVGKTQLAAMKPTAFLVDISRGGIVDHKALIEALEKGKLAGAALDVFPEEPLPADSPLWNFPNVIITPHVAGFSPAYNKRANKLFVENLRRYLAKEKLVNLVERDRGY